MAHPAKVALSAQLAAAQEQLQQRRRQRRQERIEQHLPVHTDTHGRPVSPPPFNQHEEQESATVLHPGWQSEALARALRVTRDRQRAAASQAEAKALEWLKYNDQKTQVKQAPAPPPIEENVEEATLTLYPDLAVGMLRAGLVAPGRVWLLLRYLDVDGRGWISVSTARAKLTAKESPLRLCSWRQLRNLLTQGEDIFWQRDNLPSSESRIWLRSTANVAATLSIARLRLRAVHLPVSILLETIGTVRAHLYASYHSGRKKGNPIARETIKELTHVSRRSQHTYEKRAGVKRQENWAIGAPYTEEAVKERAWQQGRAIFRFEDRKGTNGAVGKSYVAWQLPNSYSGPHEQHITATKKRINQDLVDLFMKGMTGNGKEVVDGLRASDKEDNVVARFYEHGEAAARAYNRSPETDLYWQSPKQMRVYSIWHVLPAQKDDK